MHKNYKQKTKKYSDNSKSERKDQNNVRVKNYDCVFCGCKNQGPMTLFPASGQICKNCNKQGHLASKCKSPPRNDNEKCEKDVPHARFVGQLNVREEEDNADDDVFSVKSRASP